MGRKVVVSSSIRKIVERVGLGAIEYIILDLFLVRCLLAIQREVPQGQSFPTFLSSVSLGEEGCPVLRPPFTLDFLPPSGPQLLSLYFLLDYKHHENITVSYLPLYPQST